jgi:environmental stress-induced protein Ves
MSLNQMRNLNHINDAGRNTNTPVMQLNAADAFPTRMRFKTNGNCSCFLYNLMTSSEFFKTEILILEMKTKSLMSYQHRGSMSTTQSNKSLNDTRRKLHTIEIHQESHEHENCAKRAVCEKLQYSSSSNK